MKYTMAAGLMLAVFVTLNITAFFWLSSDGTVQVVGIGRLITCVSLMVCCLVVIKTILDIFRK